MTRAVAAGFSLRLSKMDEVAALRRDLKVAAHFPSLRCAAPFA